MGSSLKRNLLYSVSYQILIMILPFIVTPYVSRVLTPDQLGEYSHANSLAYYFFLFSMLGVNSYGTREISKVKYDKSKLKSTFWQIYYIQFFLAIIAIILYLIFLYVLKLDGFLYYIQIIYLGSIFFDINWLAFGLERFRFITLRNVLIKLLSIILIFLLVKNPGDIWIYGLIMTVSVVVSLFFIWPIVFVEIGFQRPKMKLIFHHIRPDVLLMIPFLASSAFTYLDNFMLGFAADIKNVAYYTYANSLPNMLLGIMTGVVSVLMSRMSYLTVHSHEESEKLFFASMRFTSILNIGLTFGAIGVAKRFINIYLGPQYDTALPMFYVMLLTVPVNGFSSLVRSAYMIPNKMDKQAMKASLFGGIVKLLLNFIFISLIGVIGICISSVASHAFMIVIQYIYTKKEICYLKILRDMPYYILVAITMIAFIWIIESLKINVYWKIFLQIGGGGSIYVTGSLIKLLTVKDPFVNAIIDKFRNRNH